jgi:hypothetical protein
VCRIKISVSEHDFLLSVEMTPPPPPRTELTPLVRGRFGSGGNSSSPSEIIF